MISAGAVAARIAAGPGWGLLPLLVVGPAVAAAVGGALYTLAAGITAVAACLILDVQDATTVSQRPIIVALLATVGVTTFGMIAASIRERRARELAQARRVAEITQQVLLRPVPARAGPVRMTARYFSAAREAQLGGDMYEVVISPGRVRLIMADVEGHGLSAIANAAAVASAFREAARREGCLTSVASRLDDSISSDASDEFFVTAVLAEIRAASNELELVNCGHPAPLMLGPGEPRFAGTEDNGLPLGLGDLGGPVRKPGIIPFGPGAACLFYTDGVTEARNSAGRFFPLATCESISRNDDPETQLDRLGKEIVQHAGHEPDDDVALLLACRC